MLVTENTYDLMHKEYRDAVCSYGNNKDKVQWSDKIMSIFCSNSTIKTLFAYESPPLKQKDSADIASAKEVLVNSNPYTRLKTTIRKNGGFMYFGQLSNLLHGCFVGEPPAYRKGIKDTIADFLMWIDFFKLDDVIIDRPNYSQCV